MGLFSRKKKAMYYFEEAYKEAMSILNASNYNVSPNIKDEIISVLFVVTDVANFHAGKDRFEFGNAFGVWVHKNGNSDFIQHRADFYSQFLRGKKAKMEFWLGNSINDRDPILEITGAFCDILFAPDLQDDYDVNVIHVGDPQKRLMLIPQVFIPLNDLLGSLYNNVRNK